MGKYSYEEKLQVVKSVIEEHISYSDAANKIGACKGDVRKWIGLYREYGVEGLLIKNGTYDGQFKIEVVEYMHEQKLSIRETSAKFGIPSHPTVSK